jgi:hypothetical protein
MQEALVYLAFAPMLEIPRHSATHWIPRDDKLGGKKVIPIPGLNIVIPDEANPQQVIPIRRLAERDLKRWYKWSLNVSIFQ